jgi:L-ornithine Nalpha-acyltransferase
MIHSPTYAVRLARDQGDVLAAQRLRYRVFVQELGGDGPLVDHDLGLERDRFDDGADHLLLIDTLRPRGADVVGVYRLLGHAAAAQIGQYYSETEYDLTPLRRSGRKLLELGRSCLDPAHRGGTAMYHLWHGLAGYIAEHGIEVLFGVASFHGQDTGALQQPLSYLHQYHLAPPDLRVQTRARAPLALLAPAQIDRRQALRDTPALIKAYLRLGGMVGEGAFVDGAFNTVDVCLVLDTARMNDAQKRLYTTQRRCG